MRPYVIGDYNSDQSKNKSKLLDFTTSKVKTLLRILNNPFQVTGAADNTCRDKIVAIVFVKQRIVATSLASLIMEFVKMYPRELGHLNVGFAVGGISAEAYKTPGAKKMEQFDEERKKLQTTLSDFRMGRLNCIIATEVLEEGLDVHNCNMIVRFDGIPNFRSYVQSKGRARAKETCGFQSQFIIMAEEGTKEAQKLQADWENYKYLERSSIELCHSTDENLDSSSEITDLENDVYYLDPTDTISSPRITINSAISIVYRYTQSIPTDRYTKLMPFFEELYSDGYGTEPLLEGDNKDCYTCVLHLPHKTPYSGQPFQGPACLNKQIAKQRVALLACKALHQDGFLGDDLLPKKIMSSLGIDELSDDELVLGKRGTKSRKEFYPISLATEFDFDPNLSNCYLYRIIDIETNEIEDPENINCLIHGGSSRIGILVSQKLPPICGSSITMYIPNGIISVSLDYCRSFSLAEIKLQRLENFQDYAWSTVIGCKTSWMWIDRESNGTLIVPLGMNNEIEETILDAVCYKKSMETDSPSFTDLSSLRFDGRVISPKHKEFEEHYVVEESVKGSSPHSKIDQTGEETYAEYYTRKYGLTVKNENQELLLVSGADHRYNFLSRSTLKNGKIRSPKKQQMFLPELVTIEPIPTALWRKIQFVPFLLTRFNLMIR